MSSNYGTFTGSDDSRQETVGEAFADYLSLVEETIRTQVTDDDIRARIRSAIDSAASVQDDPSRIQLAVPDQHGGGAHPSQAARHIPSEGIRPRRPSGRAGDHNPSGYRNLRNRGVLLDELMALMRDPRQGPAVLAGPGGTGKTTLAAALAERARAQGAQVWWISAADPVTLSRDLTATARQLGGMSDVRAIARGEADAADRFWRLLSNASPGWLLVFDEADDPRVLAAAGSAAGVQDLTGWVRSSARGLALVTSRETDRRMWGAARLLRIGELLEADAVQMLLELAPTAGDENQARALARRLGGHPLSLRLAGSYLHSRAAQGATFAAYERTLGEQAQAGIYERGSGRHAVTATARAVNLTLDGLTRQGIPQTRPVLQLASCYAPTTIPASLFNARALTGAGLPGDLGDTSQAPHGWAEHALRELEHGGIFEPAEGGITVHTAIIEAGRASLGSSDPSSARIRHAAIELLYATTSELPHEQPTSWPQYLLLAPHLLSLLEATAGHVDREHLGLLMETAARTADAFNLYGIRQASRVLCERALASSAALGEHRAVLRVRFAMAWEIADRGGLSTAEALYRENFQIRLRVLGPEDEDVLYSCHELAWIAACQHDWATAEQGYRQTLDDSIRLLGPDDPQTLLTRHELGWAIANQGRHRLGEAREIFRTVLAGRRRVLGAEHPRTLTTLHELAWITAWQGKWKRAEAAYRKVLVMRVRLLGEDHPDTMVIRHELAWIAARRGRTAEAESRYSDVLNRRRQILGDDHPHTQATRRALEELRQGRIIDARHLA